MRKVLLRLISDLSMRKVVRITGLSEGTLRAYIDGAIIRPVTYIKLKSNIDSWISDLGDDFGVALDYEKKHAKKK